ncbi:hypothetical protein GALMADRAFT_148128 [Galerina marginata CBS 339.88]|uniref:Uncharacterized protein n=1 Tax=Galerina marginata (strain CBS 339.88) TaxID=685588 RepID=A0A067S811_GALM3|nr:hypothetical protein GALMADRAFT_148128 [Galerina marginata CBS 339.88]
MPYRTRSRVSMGRSMNVEESVDGWGEDEDVADGAGGGRALFDAAAAAVADVSWDKERKRGGNRDVDMRRWASSVEAEGRAEEGCRAGTSRTQAVVLAICQEDRSSTAAIFTNTSFSPRPDLDSRNICVSNLARQCPLTPSTQGLYLGAERRHHHLQAMAIQKA